MIKLEVAILKSKNLIQPTANFIVGIFMEAWPTKYELDLTWLCSTHNLLSFVSVETFRLEKTSVYE